MVGSSSAGSEEQHVIRIRLINVYK